MKAVTLKAAAFLLMALITLAVVAGPVDSGNEQALRWHVDVVPTQDHDVVEVVFRADITQGWILYSSDFSLDIGPRPAKFTFDANPSVSLLGPIEPLRAQRKKDQSLGGEYSYFAGTAEFRQKVRVISPTRTISGRIDGQTCFEESGVCQLFREKFDATL
jgi:cytochrome c biogenesis DsbD-like protein